MWQVLAISLCLQVTAQGIVPDSEDCGHLPTNYTPEEVRGYDLPWVVRLGYNDGGTFQHCCVGTLISQRVVLTTAHCAHPRETSEAQIIDCDSKSCSKPRKFLVEKVISHPGYSYVNAAFKNDIALIKLDSNVHDPTKVGSYVCLPEKSFSTESLLGSKLVIAGFNIQEKGQSYKPGSSSYQHVANLTTVTATPVSDETCRNIYQSRKCIIYNSHLCAVGDGKEGSNGDAAAPLFSVQGSPPRAVLKGILLFGPAIYTNNGIPTVYTNVGAHLQWIKENMATL